MGKAGKARKRQRLADWPAPAVSASDSDSPIDPDDLETTLRTLEALTPAALKDPQYKPLRRAIFNLGFGSPAAASSVAKAPKLTTESLTAQISDALRASQWTDALLLLYRMRLSGQVPKLGALQRWVRDCDATNPTQGDPEVLGVLAAIMLTTTATTTGPETRNPLVRHPAWRFSSSHVDQRGSTSNMQVFNDAVEHKLFEHSEAPAIRSCFKVISTTPGADRKPPNKYPAVIYSSIPSAIPLDHSHPPAVSHPVPNVPGASLIENILHPSECRAIVRSAEAVGFLPDQAVRGSALELSSVLAHNFYWLADEPFCEELFKRIKACVPAEVDGGVVRCVNRRFRVYRYVPGAVYRPHIDGAWPPSGTNPTTGAYVYDASPATSPQFSRFTLLIYLNDEFSAGETTFFTPSTEKIGVLEAWPVKPVQGCALLFPHGDTRGSLVHEGSGVASGGKYIIRTDVVYDVKVGASRVRKESST